MNTFLKTKKWSELTRKEKVAGLILLSALVLLLAFAIVSTNKATSPAVSQVRVGDVGVLRAGNANTVFLAADRDAFDQMQKDFVSNDTVSFFELASQGRAFGVSSGTKALIIDSAVGSRQVRILESAQGVDQNKIGRTGWIPAEWVVVQ